MVFVRGRRCASGSLRRRFGAARAGVLDLSCAGGPRQIRQDGWRQHALIPGPNAGWSEAAIAGALQRRLIGPIWANNSLVTELWIGEPADPEGGSADDYRNAVRIVSLTAALFVAIGLALS